MRYLKYLLCFLLTACHFSPLYQDKKLEGVCVASIPNESGYQMYRVLKQYFPENKNCQYTLQVTVPKSTLSDQSISVKDFITMQQVHVSTDYTLLNKNKEIVLKNTLFSKGSTAIVSNPYSTVIATEKTEQNLYISLAEQIAFHVAAFLDRNQ